MNAAVWDTYVKRKSGSVLHFDILVPESETGADTIFGFGREYLASIHEAEALLDVQQCQFCHVEELTDEMKKSFSEKGYFIIDLGEIPASLPANPTRRDMILHLRAHFAEHRFADFRQKTTEKIEALIQKVLS